ncbi:hypothetical protein INR49_023116 [Caranx melampygus]|nr:hypothetical protein INR49_023116 [Caranx melampygus]
MTHESKLEPCKDHSRLRPGVFEDRLSSQERTLAVLLQQAFRITEEVASGLHSSKGSVQVEALSASCWRVTY